jgi:hypothetical protein
VRPLPVLRVRYNDPQETWLYVDPSRGAVVQRNEKVARLRRWLYQGLHSLDFPFLYYQRPLWDSIVIVLSIGGAVLTTMMPAWRRLKRHAIRIHRLAVDAPARRRRHAGGGARRRSCRGAMSSDGWCRHRACELGTILRS